MHCNAFMNNQLCPTYTVQYQNQYQFCTSGSLYKNPDILVLHIINQLHIVYQTTSILVASVMQIVKVS